MSLSSNCHEIVTVQVGHYANYIGTHLWNIRENSFVYDESKRKGPNEINHDVLFREGCNLMGDVTYTPRLVAIDLKGSLKSLREDGVLYDIIQTQDDVKWNHDVTMHKEEAAAKNTFLLDLDKQQELLPHGRQRQPTSVKDDESDIDATTPMEEDTTLLPGEIHYHLDASVTVWSDYLKTHLHPRSMHIINQFQRSNELHPFDVYGCGVQVIKDHRTWSDIEDKLHFFLEEADHLQGIQLLVDTFDAFGGVGSSVLEQIVDDYDNKTLLTFGVCPAVFDDSTIRQTNHRLINTILSYSQLFKHSSMFVPLSLNVNPWRSRKPHVQFPHLQYKADLNYHTSAILAAAIDTASLPYRLHKNPSYLAHMEGAMTTLGRKVSALQTSFPFPITEGGNLVTDLESQGNLPWSPLSPCCPSQQKPYLQSVVLRGISNANVLSPPGPSAPVLFRQCESGVEVLEEYLNQVYTSLSASVFVESPCNVSAPFPHMFQPYISTSGAISQNTRNPVKGVDTVPVMTALQSTPSSGTMLEMLYSEGRKIDIKRSHAFLEAGLELDEYNEILEELLTQAQSYENRISDQWTQKNNNDDDDDDDDDS